MEHRVGIDLRGRLPLRLYHTVDGVALTVRSIRYPSGPRQRLFLQAGNGRADPVTITLRWRIPCRPAVEACEAPPPIAIVPLKEIATAAVGRISVTCAECGREADERARGWRAPLAEEWEADGSLYVVTFCPECAEREFGKRDGVIAG